MSAPTDDGGDDLRYRAMLYASGEMSADASDAFEGALVDDEMAQKALVEAVQLFSMFDGRAKLPRSEYRDQVREVLIRRPFWMKLIPARYRSQPRVISSLVSGCAVGVALAFLLIGITGSSERLGECEPPPFETAQIDSGVEVVSANNDDDAAPMDWFGAADDDEALGMAEAWAEMSNCGDHLQKAIEDDQRRRSRWRLDGMRDGRHRDALSQTE